MGIFGGLRARLLRASPNAACNALHCSSFVLNTHPVSLFPPSLTLPRIRCQFSMATDFPTLCRLLPLDVMIPLQRHLTVQLPSDGRTDSRSRAGHGAFTAAAPTVRRFVDKVEILQSLQKPKKITLIGSDGAVRCSFFRGWQWRE